MRPSLFISDLHLSPERPGPAGLLRRFLEEQAPAAAHLYLLGDFFETWLGDDDLALPFHAELVQCLRRLADAGTALHFMAGNRDFLAGGQLAAAAGFDILPDPCLVDLHGVPTLLSHGDAWCLDDAKYQAFRAQVRGAAWQGWFLGKPLEERRAIAAGLREQSEQSKADKRLEIMDVNQDAVAEAFRRHDATRIIHGHTHRPGRHETTLDGSVRERWVLPDWYGEAGGYLACDETGCRLETL